MLNKIILMGRLTRDPAQAAEFIIAAARKSFPVTTACIPFISAKTPK